MFSKKHEQRLYHKLLSVLLKSYSFSQFYYHFGLAIGQVFFPRLISSLHELTIFKQIVYY